MWPASLEITKINESTVLSIEWEFIIYLLIMGVLLNIYMYVVPFTTDNASRTDIFVVVVVVVFWVEQSLPLWGIISKALKAPD